MLDLSWNEGSKSFRILKRSLKKKAVALEILTGGYCKIGERLRAIAGEAKEAASAEIVLNLRQKRWNWSIEWFGSVQP